MANLVLKARRQPKRKSREPVGVHIDKPRPSKAKPTRPQNAHTFTTQHARWFVWHDADGHLHFERHA
jgi:hypothetical protein